MGLAGQTSIFPVENYKSLQHNNDNRYHSLNLKRYIIMTSLDGTNGHSHL